MKKKSLALSVIPKPVSTALAVITPTVINPPGPDAEVNQLIEQARSILLRGRDYRLAMGAVLLRIHELRAKSGCGSFTATLRQIGIAYNTAHDYMKQALMARGHYEIRNEDSDEVMPFDPNNGEPDAVAQAMAAHHQKLIEAKAKDADVNVLRDVNWKFTAFTYEMATELLAAKKTLGNQRAAVILINAAKEVVNVNLAA